MNRSPKRWLIRLALVAVVGLAGALWANRQQAQQLLFVENQSGQPITSLRVTVGGQTRSFDNMAPASQVTLPLGDKSDRQVVVEGKLADGNLISHRSMAAEPGSSIIVRPDGLIEVRKRKD